MDKLKILRENLKLENTQAIVISSCTNRFYFSDFKSSAGLIVITSDNAYLMVDFRYIEVAKKETTGFNVIEISAFTEKNEIEKIFNKNKITSVYLENSCISLSKAQYFEKLFSDLGAKAILNNSLDKAIIKQRQIKSLEEINRIKKAQSLTDDAFEFILKSISENDTERDIALKIEMFMRKNGASSVSFDLITIFGSNTSMPHGVPGDKKLCKGDMVTLDIGAVVDGYCSDMTRTFAYGSVTDEQKHVYYTVLKAQEEALKAIKPGVECQYIDSKARNFIYSAGFEGCFGHGTGHSLGIEIHELPNFRKGDNTILTPGMIMTVEPGIYLQDRFGVRIEDMIVVTNDGFENLTHSNKELIVL